MKAGAILSRRQVSQRTAFALLIAATIIVVVPVFVIILEIIFNGAGAISWDFLTLAPVKAGKAGGIFPRSAKSIELSPEIKAADRERPEKTVVLVIDRSGSMSGKKIEQARAALTAA